MRKIQKILEKKEILPYLQKRNLIKRYKKVKNYLLQGSTIQTKFKERNPKGSGIWYFRINKQYRAFCVFNEEGDLIVFKIDDLH